MGKNKIVLILGGGGPAGIGMERCLRATGIDVYSTDDSLWSKQMIDGKSGWPEENPDLYLPIPDSLVWRWVNTPEYPIFLPDKKQVELCQDKAMCASILGDLAPKTYWIRDTKGAGGKGAQMASEYLPGRNFSVEFVYKDGEELARFQKERISYLVKAKEMDVTKSGSSAVSICRKNRRITEIARLAITKIARHTQTPLHGFYGVDLKESEDGSFKVTEINAGRLLTASYSYYWLTGYNLPLIGINAALGLPKPKRTRYPLRYGIIRQIDQEPKLFTPEQTEDWE